jgi:hypothetical protein
MLQRVGIVVVEFLSGITLAGVMLALATLLFAEGLFSGRLPWLLFLICTAAVMLRPGGTLHPRSKR